MNNFILKSNYSDELKLKVVHYVLDGHSMLQATKKFYVREQIVQKWIDAYSAHSVNGIRIR